jgi:hypothetical protein
VMVKQSLVGHSGPIPGFAVGVGVGFTVLVAVGLATGASGAHALSPRPTVMAMAPAMIPRFISLFSQYH